MIHFELDADGIALVTLGMPGRAVNVIGWDLVRALDTTIDRLAADDAVKGVVLTSGKAGFVAGADLAIIQDFVREGVTPAQAADLIGRVGRAFRRLETLGKPVVGASPGTALGGGLELLLACHHRIAADVPAAQYGLPEVGLGLLPGAGGTQRVPRLVGIAKGLPLLVEGQTMPTSEALAIGLLHAVVPPDQLIDGARQALREGRVDPVAPWDKKGFKVPGGDSSQPALNDVFSSTNGRIFARTHGLQPAPKAIVSCVYEGSRLPMERALRIEQMYFAQLVQGTVAQAMVRTLFFGRQAAGKRAQQSERAAGAGPTASCVDAYVREGLRLRAEGVAQAEIDNAALSTGMARGPLAMADAMALPQGQPHDAMEANATPALPPGRVSQADIAERLLAVQVLCAAEAHLRGEAASPGETDFAAVMDGGFPRHLGGPLGAIDDEGAATFVQRMKRMAAAHGPRFLPPQGLEAMALTGQRFHPSTDDQKRAGG